MGNCIRNPNATTHTDGKRRGAGEEVHTLVELGPEEGGKKLRIKVVLTQRELKQILEYHNGSITNFTSMEDLMRSVRKRRSSRRGCYNTSAWIPALHTIHEDD